MTETGNNSKAYLELEAQPAPIVVYTPNLKQHKKNRIPIEKVNKPISYGIVNHTIKETNRLKTGDI